MKDFEQAIEYFKKAAAFNGSGRYLDNVTLYTLLGIALHNLKEFNRAISYIEEAKNGLPENDIKKVGILILFDDRHVSECL